METPPLSTSRPPGAQGAWDKGGAIADLDGDGRPDLAIVEDEGQRSSGVSYRVDLRLSSHVGLSSFNLLAPQGGLYIVPRDVDGDGDLDLVITSAWSRAPVAVWINDGHGVFTPGDSSAYPRYIWIEGPGILSDTPHEILQAMVVESYRPCSNFFGSSHFCNELHFDRLRLLLAFANHSTIALSQPRTRAPPSPSRNN